MNEMLFCSYPIGVHHDFITCTKCKKVTDHYHFRKGKFWVCVSCNTIKEDAQQ